MDTFKHDTFIKIIREIAHEAISDNKIELSFSGLTYIDKRRLLNCAMNECARQEIIYFLTDGDMLALIVQEIHKATREEDYAEHQILLKRLGALLIKNALSTITKKINDSLENEIDQILTEDEDGNFKPNFSGNDRPIYNSPNL